MQKLIMAIAVIVGMFYALTVQAIGLERNISTAILTLEQIVTPANPSNGFTRIYVKPDGKLYTLTSLGVETELGSGGGAGINVDPNTLARLSDFDTSLGLTNVATVTDSTFRLTHDPSITQYAEKTISVPVSFRSVSLLLFVDVLTTATANNLKVVITDETNATTLVDAVLLPQLASLPVNRYVEFKTVSTTASIKVRIEALAEAGSPTSDFADVYIKKSQYSSPRTAYILDAKTTGTAGGASSTGSWITRDLNTIEGEIDIVKSLSANVFTLESGLYEIEVYAPAFLSNSTKVRLFDVVNAETIIEGGTFYGFSAAATMTAASVIATLLIENETQIRVEQQFASSHALGLGYAASYGTREIYTNIKITKLR